ncbi:hypothetical protein BHE74_00027295 [Ensete ventricosum]|nr:hypothetical protein BHE74_00027295 [Ensete ventricosum]RZS03450.1 hypothetical protein BHM03_00033635 [Ensete ventricosum]
MMQPAIWRWFLTFVYVLRPEESAAMEGTQWKGSVHRIRKCVVDLLSMEDDLVDDDDEDAWELMGSDLRLKSTFLYCDLNQVISHAREERKKVLTDLANKLFYYMEQLDHAVRIRSMSLTQVCYNDTASVLQEVMAALMALR